MKNTFQKWLTGLLVVCLTLGFTAGALAEAPNASSSDFEFLEPLMDLVAAASLVAHEEDPQPVPGEGGTLDADFVREFFHVGITADPTLNIGEGLLADTAGQAAYLQSIFAASFPELVVIPKTEAIYGYIGFRPVTVNTAVEGDGIQIIGEIYWAAKPIKQIGDDEFDKIMWTDHRGIFTFKKDSAAANGFRLEGFSLGVDLNLEDIMEDYEDSILVEFLNSNLGFSVKYPSVFDEVMEEDAEGMNAVLPDGSASFSVRRSENTERVDLRGYMDFVKIQNPNATLAINDDIQYGTTLYNNSEGYTIFTVYIVTEDYVFTSELSYKKELNQQYHMYTHFLENTFMVHEISVG